MTASGDRADDSGRSERGLRSAGQQDLDVAGANIEQPLARLVTSVEPSVVFASLAARCAPELCDVCTVDIVDGAHARYRIAYPLKSAGSGVFRRLTDRAAAAPDHVVRVDFASPTPTDGRPKPTDDVALRESFHGVATFVWHRRTATDADRVTMTVLVEHAVNTVAWQRSERAAHTATVNANNLTHALHNSRHIGIAIGILMSSSKITEDRALDLLRTASQRANRKLRDLALDVIDTGRLDPALLGDGKESSTLS